MSKITAEELRVYQGKHFGIGFMRSIGFPCKKHQRKKNHYHVWHHRGSLINVNKSKKVYLGAFHFDKLAHVLINNGYDHTSQMKSKHQTTNFAFTSEKNETITKNKASIIETCGHDVSNYYK